jgi:hypothetical protein
MPAAGGGGGPSSGTANDAAAATGRLISTSGRVELPRVLTGDSLGLTSVTIRSHSTRTIEVSLQSSLDQVTFQLNNANLEAGCGSADEQYHDEDDEGDDDWNGMLNEVRARTPASDPTHTRQRAE